jgi:type II secretory pathway component PulF
MSHFRYRAIAPTGDLVAGEVEVPSRQEVVRRRDRLGRATTTLKRGDAFRSRTQWHCEMTAFLRQRAVLVGAGVTLEAALQAGGHDTSHALAWLHRNVHMPVGTWSTVGLGAGSAWNQPWARVAICAALASLRRTTGLSGERCAPRAIAVFRLLVENGVPFSTAPKIVRDVVPEPHHAVAAECAHQRGHNRYLFAMRRLRIDEATAAIALIARHAARFCEHTFDIGLDRLMGAVAVAPTFIVGAPIATLVASIMGAPLGITELAT